MGVKKNQTDLNMFFFASKLLVLQIISILERHFLPDKKLFIEIKGESDNEI